MIKFQRRIRATVSEIPALTAIIFAVSTSLSAVNASEADDPAWRRFQHELGEPAAIGAQSDHPMADAVTRPLPPIDLHLIDPQKFLLGNDLFHERQLSRDGSVACISCHAGPISGTDGRPVSFGVARAMGRFNALTTFNANYGFRQFWDGRSITLADQAIEPLISDLELASTRDDALQFLAEDEAYREYFNLVYPDGVTLENMQDAMAHFQSIHFAVTETPFQSYLRDHPITPASPTAQNNHTEPMSDQAIRGWETFQSVGCSQCHNGIGLGGNSYQKIGALRPFYSSSRVADPDDRGLEERSGRSEDRYSVKVPALHNVAMTAPYYHDGSESSLTRVIEDMAETQLARELSEEESADLLAFLKSLTGRPYGLSHRQDITEMAKSETAANATTRQGSPKSHQQAYQAAARAVAPAFQQLLGELDRIASKSVLHFDFVQFQHRELIRLARALRHPPSDTNNDKLSCLSNMSRTLLQETLALEWPIADFLRASATLDILDIRANTSQQQPKGRWLPTVVTADTQQQDLQESRIAIETAAIATLAGKLVDCAL
jgi:cytochrome c peroxidase